MLYVPQKLDLTNVTIAVIDTVCHELTRMAVEKCKSNAKFGGIRIFSDRDMGPDTVRVSLSSFDEAMQFSLYELPNYLDTSHVMFMHWDSWIIDPGMWRKEFLECDYIGAPWWYKDGLNVGNSGFSLRSVRLMKYLTKHKDRFPPGDMEDSVLCRQYRPILEKEGFTWASEELATEFSFERKRPAIDSRHFGFHGAFNFPFVCSYEELNEIMAIARKNPYLQKNGMLDEIYGIWAARYGVAYGISRG